MDPSKPRHSPPSGTRKRKYEEFQDDDEFTDEFDENPGSPETPTPAPRFGHQGGNQLGSQLGNTTTSTRASRPISKPARRRLFPDAPTSGDMLVPFPPASQSTGGPQVLASDDVFGYNAPPDSTVVAPLPSTSPSDSFDSQSSTFVPESSPSFGPPQPSIPDPVNAVESWRRAVANGAASQSRPGPGGNRFVGPIDPRLLAPDSWLSRWWPGDLAALPEYMPVNGPADPNPPPRRPVPTSPGDMPPAPAYNPSGLRAENVYGPSRRPVSLTGPAPSAGTPPPNGSATHVLSTVRDPERWSEFLAVVGKVSKR
ncbi:hypothetical protein C8A00DRAFT_33809 [Chaetomidium leptoderma]|uniref:Uncharacterized protein n=1 Tax=Chaetomidium leptoderma TaxID=669021 RepID=A0AAN6VME0_9PEZI|nr:hypothetical protein C8A00DRAFT_33809 [Chaetomidium leptoderma]